LQTSVAARGGIAGRRSRVSARHGAQKLDPVFVLIFSLTFTKVHLMSGRSIEEHAMPAGHHTVFRPEPAEIARPCCTLDATLFRLQPRAANGLPLSEREVGMP
jgi:hypothetical protein